MRDEEEEQFNALIENWQWSVFMIQSSILQFKTQLALNLHLIVSRLSSLERTTRKFFFSLLKSFKVCREQVEMPIDEDSVSFQLNGSLGME